MLFVQLLALQSAALKLQLPTSVGRREAATLLSSAVLAAPLAASAALKPCPNGAGNCYSSASTNKNKISTWSWPSGTSRTDAIKQLREVLEAYPKAGQGDVDGGGWDFKVDELTDSGYAKLEFKSAGTGNLARFFNGGKPFIDDFEVSVEDSSICLRSSSRAGDSDFGVNFKRVNYIAAGLREKGWAAEGVKP